MTLLLVFDSQGPYVQRRTRAHTKPEGCSKGALVLGAFRAQPVAAQWGRCSYSRRMSCDSEYFAIPVLFSKRKFSTIDVKNRSCPVECEHVRLENIRSLLECRSGSALLPDAGCGGCHRQGYVQV